MRGAFFGLSMVILMCSPALADWQYTKWGMTKEQVVEASKGQATPTGTKGALVAPYEGGGYQFQASFGFDKTGGLSSVGLELKDGSHAIGLRNALLGKYGKAGKEVGSLTESPPPTPGSDLDIKSYGLEWWTETDHVSFSYTEIGWSFRMKVMATQHNTPIPPPKVMAYVTYSTLTPKNSEGL
jgi:hypothetical protein